MKTKKLFFPLFLVILSITVLIPFNSVNAVSYYNWIENPSFIQYSNYIEDYSFESGLFDSGVLYGNFTDADSTCTILSSEPNSGVYHAFLNYPTSRDLQYNLSSSYYVLGADIIKLSAYVLNINNLSVTVYYTDETSDSDFYDGSGSYSEIDFTDVINSMKYVKTIRFTNVEGSGGGSIDDIYLIVDNGEGQDAITQSSLPWFLGGAYPSYFGYINNVLGGRLDDTRVILQGETTYKIIQNLNFIDTDYLQYINVYVSASTSNEQLTISVVYSDRTEDSKTMNCSGVDSDNWEELNFGKSWIDINKYIIQIRISIGNSDTAIDIDDVGLWLSVPTSFDKFSFTISPQPISISSFDFSAYSNTVYTMNCYYYNETTQTLNENGTYIISSVFGISSGDVVNGVFSIDLNSRTYTATPYTSEAITVTVITEDEVFNAYLTAYWYPTGGDITDGITDVTGDFMLNWFIIAIFLLIVPLGIVATITGIMNESGGHVNPTMLLTTFLASETLMGAVSLSIGIINIWFMFVIIVVDVLIILGLIRSNN